MVRTVCGTCCVATETAAVLIHDDRTTMGNGLTRAEKTENGGRPSMSASRFTGLHIMLCCGRKVSIAMWTITNLSVFSCWMLTHPCNMQFTKFNSARIASYIAIVRPTSRGLLWTQVFKWLSNVIATDWFFSIKYRNRDFTVTFSSSFDEFPAILPRQLTDSLAFSSFRDITVVVINLPTEGVYKT